MSDFSSLWQGPHFSISSPSLGREVLSPHPFLKKRTPGPQPVFENQVFVGHDKDLTFQSCVQDLAQNIRPRIRFRKNQDLHGRLPRHVRFSQPMTRIALCSTVPQVCAEKFVTTPISEKTTAGAGPVGHIMGPARATLFQVGGQNFSKLEVVLNRCWAKIEIAFILAQPSKMTTLWAILYAAKRLSTTTQNEPPNVSEVLQVVLLTGQKYYLEYLPAIKIDTGLAQKLNENCCPNMSWEIFVAGPAAHREVFIFHTVWPGPRYPTLCP